MLKVNQDRLEAEERGGKSMKVKGKEKSREWIARSKHHAKTLTPLAKIAAVIVNKKIIGMRFTTRGFHVTTTQGTYVFCPIKRYKGIQIRKAGKCLVEMIVVSGVE